MATEARRVLRICLGPAISPSLSFLPPLRLEHRNELREERGLPQRRERDKQPLGKPLNSRP
jgi:hypothetical protein